MTAEPPPLPGASRKRILPAFVLCFTIGFLGAHRFYVGRWMGGTVQLLASLGSFWWLKTAAAGLFDLRTVEDAMAWASTNQPPLSPMMVFLAVTIWISADAVRLAAGTFQDGSGQRISRWF